MRETALYAENLYWVAIRSATIPDLMSALAEWRDANLKAAVLDITILDGYSYAGRISQMKASQHVLSDYGRTTNPDYSVYYDPAPSREDWGMCTAVITLQAD